MFFEGLSVHLLIAAAVALIVVGPKDLPVMLRKLGQFMARVRAMAAEFRASFDEMARQSELDELRKEVEAMRQGQFGQAVPEANQAFDEISQGLSDVGVELNGPVTPYVFAQTETIEAVEAPKVRARKAGARKTGAKRPAAKAAAKKAPALKTAAKPVAKPKAAAKAKPVAKTAAKSASVKPRARKAARS